MHTLYGYITWQQNQQAAHAAVARMMAAVAAYSWADSSVDSVAVREGGGGLAVQTAGEPGRLPAGSAGPLHRAGLTVAADMRLDNRTELGAALALDPAFAATLSDPELLLHAYRRWDADCVAHLLGDFAFAIWDESRQRLFCARDFAGVRPFYYHHRPGRGVVLAGDLRALLAHPDVPHRLNLPYVKAYLLEGVGQFQHPARTFYEEVDKLPPAHCLTVDRAGLRLWPYWEPGRTPERRYADEGDYVAEVRSLLHEAVACRVQDSVHGVGAHLSGGLDSSSVAVLAHRVLQEQGRTVTGFSWAPPYAVVPGPDDERSLVEAVAQAAGLPLRFTTLTAAHNLEHAQIDITVQPRATLLLELAASEDAAGLGNRTMLSGWGGDELLVFNGRGYFADLFRRGRWLTLQRELSRRGELHGNAVWKQWITSGMYPLLPTALLRRLSPDNSPPPVLPAALRPDFAAALAGVEPLTRPDLRERPGVRRMQIALLKFGHIPYRLESWAAHGAGLGMAYAFPLLDRRIIEFALSIPDYMYFKNGWKRYLYRTAMQGILPDAVRWHKVKGDLAMTVQTRQVGIASRAARHEQLRGRAGNPFVDVDKLIDADDAVAEAADTNTGGVGDGGADQRAERRALLARRAAINGQWLAFVRATEG